MIYNSQESYENLIAELNERAIKYVVHEFTSGAKMIDIWYKDLFYVVQIEDDFIGISLVDDDNIGLFDIIPDDKFFSTEEFVTKIRGILG